MEKLIVIKHTNPETFTDETNTFLGMDYKVMSADCSISVVRMPNYTSEGFSDISRTLYTAILVKKGENDEKVSS